MSRRGLALGRVAVGLIRIGGQFDYAACRRPGKWLDATYHVIITPDPPGRK